MGVSYKNTKLGGHSLTKNANCGRSVLYRLKGCQMDTFTPQLLYHIICYMLYCMSLWCFIP